MRVIAGQYGGRKLGVAPDGVRPTSDRVRESLFAILEPLAEARVLDLFAGTGALGIEALSRGASGLVSVDRSSRAIAALRKNLERLGIEEGCRVIRGDSDRVLKRLDQEGERFDLVFLDPPYDDGVVGPTLIRLAGTSLLAPGARVVVEGATRHSVPPVPGFVVDDERTYGDTVVRILSASAPESTDAEA